MRTGLVLFLLVGCSDSEPDDMPLAVLHVQPPADAVDVPLDTAITLELSEPPPPDFAVTLAAETGEPIAHAMSIDGTTVTLAPSDPLWLATRYSIGTGDFTSTFATRDGTWRNVALYTQPMVAAAPLGSGAAPNLATLPDGVVLAGWESGTALFDAKFTPASGWSTPHQLAITGGDADAVDIAAVSASRAVAGHEKWVTRANIEARTFDGTQWSPPADVAPYTVGTTRFDQYLSGVAATDQTFALTFHRGDFDTDRFDLYASINNGTWSVPFLVEQLPGSAAGADIVDDGRGGYVIAWIQRSGSSTAVWATTLSSSGVVGTPQMLDDGPGTTYSLSVARGGTTVWIAWMHQQGTIGMRVVAQAFGGARHQIDLDGYSFGGEWARITASARGALLAYTQYGGVFAATTNGSAWSAVAELDKISMVPGFDVGRPAIALDDRGNATAVWTRVPPDGRRTTMVARARGGQWSAPAQLDEGTASTYAWAAGVDAAGRVTTTWTQREQTGYTVWGAHLE